MSGFGSSGELRRRPPDGRGGPHVFVVDLEDPELTVEDRHHLATVLRLRDGDEMTISDGLGRWQPCRFGATIESCGDLVLVPPPTLEVGVGFALIKGDRPELVVQKLTEMGVDRIVPLTAERSVVRWDAEKATRQFRRLERVAREASMQSRRVRLPVVESVAPFGSVADAPGVALAESGGGPVDLARPMLLVGPEGGWTAGELSDRPRVGLGPTVLRAETAAMVAGALLTALRDGGG